MKFSKEERKKHVKDLRDKGYTIREIAEKLEKSSRDIVEDIKEIKKEEDEAKEVEIKKRSEKEEEKLFLSARSEALKLYKEGTSPLDVAIKLNLSGVETNMIFNDYCSLQHQSHLLQIYRELNNNNSFNDFTELFSLIKDKNFSIQKC